MTPTQALMMVLHAENHIIRLTTRENLIASREAVKILVKAASSIIEEL